MKAHQQKVQKIKTMKAKQNDLRQFNELVLMPRYLHITSGTLCVVEAQQHAVHQVSTRILCSSTT